MADKLALYNAALRKLGQTRIVDLSEDVKGRRVLDQCYDEVLADCLEEGWWNFALRSAKLDYDASYVPSFGRDRVYDIPDDWVRTYRLCSDESFYCPILDYQTVGRQWLMWYDSIYLQWVDSGVLYGGNLGAWPRSYTKFVEWSLALEACEDITGNDSRMEKLFNMKKKAKYDARKLDAMADPVTRFTPQGSWERSRRGAGRYGMNSGEGRYRAG